MSGILQTNCPPLNPSKIFSAPPPPFGLSVTTNAPFFSPKNQVIPPKILQPSQVINNDQSVKD